MKKMKKMKERIISLALIFVMIISLFTGMAPVEVHAEEPILSIVENPITTSAVKGETSNNSVSFSVKYTGPVGASVLYEWYKCDDMNKTNPQKVESGRPDSSYYFPTDQVGDFYYYASVKIGDEYVETDVVRVSINETAGFNSATITETNMKALLDLLVDGQPVNIDALFNNNPATCSIELTDTRDVEVYASISPYSFAYAYRTKGSTDAWTFIWDPVIVDKDAYEYAIITTVDTTAMYPLGARNTALDTSKIICNSENIKVDSAWMSDSFFTSPMIAFVEKGELATPTYPLDIEIEPLGADSITIDDQNMVHFDFEESDEFVYFTTLLPESYLGGKTAEQYVAMFTAGQEKPVVDMDTLKNADADDIGVLQTVEGTVYISNLCFDGLTSTEIPATEKSVAVMYKFHKDNVIRKEYASEAENPYGVGTEAYIYAVYGVHAEVVLPTGIGAPSEGTFVDKIKVQLDWNKVPTLEVGMNYDTIAGFEENPITVTATGVGEEMIYDWAVKVTENHKITEEDDYYEEILELWGEQEIRYHNEYLDEVINVYGGWTSVSDLLRNPYYAINEDDTYGMVLVVDSQDGYTFGSAIVGGYAGEVTGNIRLMHNICDKDYLMLFFRLGTVADMEQEKNPPVVTAPVITDQGQPKNVSAKVGETATFSVTATGDDLEYQWMIDRNDGNGFVDLTQSTGATHTTTELDMSCNGFKYKCVISNSAGSVTTNVVTLTVTEKTSVHTHSLTLVPEKAATCTEPGNKAYYTCSGCDSLFADAKGTTTTTAKAVTVKALGHDWSGEWTIIKEATKTEEGKKETLCERDCGQKKVVTISKVGEVDENENFEKDAEVTPEAPIEEVTLNNTKTELLESNIFSDAERKDIENGAEARVWLEIDKVDESKISSKDKSELEKKAKEAVGENATITYFDATLFKQVGDDEAKLVEKSNKKLEITIVIPEELLNSDKTKEREYKILRLHKGEVTVIDGTFDAETGEFSFETDRFSTYGIIYADSPVEDAEKPGNTGTPGGIIVPEADKLVASPKTGENNATLYACVLMLLSGLGYYFSTRKREGNE